MHKMIECHTILEKLLFQGVRIKCLRNIPTQGFMQDKIIVSHVTHVSVDTWMLTVKPVNVSDDLKWTTNTCDTIYTHF